MIETLRMSDYRAAQERVDTDVGRRSMAALPTGRVRRNARNPVCAAP